MRADDDVLARASGTEPTRDAGSENFPVASRLLAARYRTPVMAFYRFARAADDVADDPARDAAEKLATLDTYEAGLAGRPGAADAVALYAVIGDRPVLTAQALALLGAFRQDAVGARYDSWGDLHGYCVMSAVPVGRFLLGLHGEADNTRAFSDPLCIALQVLNHMQDLKTDHDRLGRVYLPEDWLTVAGGRRAHMSRPSLSPAARAAVDLALDECAVLLRDAAPLPRAIRSRGLRGQAAATLALARTLLRRLREEDPLRGRVTASRLDIARAGLIGLAVATAPPR